LSLLTILEKGTEAVGEAAAAFLRGRSRRLWDMATRAAPAAAVELTLKTIRVYDERDPGDSVVWCPAWQLAAAPRPYVRLLGLTSRVWPRRFGDDSILPNHIVRAEELDTDPPAEADLRAFENIKSLATKGVVLSRSRRNPQGSLIGPSPLFPSHKSARSLARARTPEHALTESDRLYARPLEAAQTPLLKSTAQCWRDWHLATATAHDGIVQVAHPVVRQAIRRVQSPTSLTRLLRDPLGFIWQYALGWHSQPRKEQPLTLPADEFGRLVHELIRRTVDALEPSPGFTVAHQHEIETALADAVRVVTESWPIERPVPPHVLWINTVRQAAEMSFAGLTLEKFTEAGTRSWTEVPFGQTDKQVATLRELPWNPGLPVLVPGTTVTIHGCIDRVDLRAGGVAVRVTDYKTGERPRDPEKIVIAGGAELQRVLYALASGQLLSGTPAIRSRLIYLKDRPAVFPLLDPDQTIEQVSKFVAAACAALEAGKAVPGIATELDTNDLRFALPASPGYFRRKRLRFRETVRELTRFWSAK
jgi:RecB family exonuclease